MSGQPHFHLFSSFPAGDWVFEDGNIAVLPTMDVTKNIKALCTGDLDRSHIPGMKTEPSIRLETSDQTIFAGNDKPFELPVFAKVDRSYHALSLVLQINRDVIQLQNLDIIPNPKLVDGIHSYFLYNLIDNELRIAWYNLDQVEIPENEPLFTLKMQMNNAAAPVFSIGDNSAFADFDARVIPDAQLLIPKVEVTGSELSFTVFPNPANDQVEFTYFLPESGHLSLSIYNSLGQKTILLNEINQSAGIHSLPVTLTRFMPGVYSVVLEILAGNQCVVKTLKIVVSGKTE
ncbi:MAG: T9SS type A sorting domain-containing protein [Bacteroidetes bacterium]|nr:T9SS type A sorting domain-containing protein [Bacteroidota bacterium]